MLHFSRVLPVLVLLTLLSGCVVPEDFELELKAQPDRLSINYDGKLIVLDVYANKDQMKPSDKAVLMKSIDESLRNDTQKNKGTYSSDYSLDGTMDIRMNVDWPYDKLGRNSRNFGNTFQVKHQGNGIFVLESMPVKPGDQNYFKSLGIDLDDISGEVSFVPEKGISVLEHNADSEPGMFSKAYKWDLDMGRGDTMRLVIEVASVKKALAEKQAREEKERREAQAAYEAKIRQMSDDFDSQLIKYNSLVSEARQKAQEAYNHINFVDLKCTSFSKKGLSRRVPYWYYLTLSGKVANNTGYDLTIYRYQLVVTDKDGQNLSSAKFRLDSSNISRGQSLNFSEEFHLRDIDERKDLRDRFLNGDVTVSVTPVVEQIRINGSRLKPDGSPFLPKRPHADFELIQHVIKEKGFSNDYEKDRYQALVQNGRISDLQAAPETFDHAPSSITLIRTPAHKEPAHRPQKTAVVEQKDKPEPTGAAQIKTPQEESPGDISNDKLKTPVPEVGSPTTTATWIEPETGIEFIQIPAGCFEMGSPNTEKGRESTEGPVHSVCVDSFWMSKYEVTNEEYKRFDPKHTVKDFHGHHIDLPTQPAVFVSWNDAKKYAAWLTSQDKEHEYRLPTEAEWEYAARAGTTTARYWGDDPDKASSYANTADDQFKRLDKSAPIHHCDDGFVVSAPVGQFEPNKFGLYDMLGNVWEWCEDTYEDNAYRTLGKNNPIELNSSGGKVLRGGSWRYGPDNVRSAQRAENKPGDQQANIGFRLVRISIGQGPAVLAAQKEDPSNPVQELGKGLKKIDSFLKSLPF